MNARLTSALAAIVTFACSAAVSAEPVVPPAPGTGGLTPASAPAEAFSGEIKLVLWKSLVRADPKAAGANLILDLSANKGSWGRIDGIGMGYNNGAHWGVVEDAKVDGSTIKLRLNLRIEDDQWVEGGSALYEVELTRDAKGVATGTFKGVFAGREASGKATADVLPPRPVMVKDFRPVEPGEHPRILFRKHELPALKERLKTPLGQAYLAKIQEAPDVISLGMMYQLTGDKKYAEAAIPIVRKHVEDDDQYVSDHGAGSGGWGHTLVADTIAYDLCHDAWPEAFRKQVDGRLQDVLPKLVRYVAVTSHANTHPCSNYYGPGHGAPAIASLFYASDKGPAPEKVKLGGGVKDDKGQVKLLPPPADYTPAEGTPIVAMESGKVPAKWLWTGPIPVKARPETLGRTTTPKLHNGSAVKFGAMKDGKTVINTFTFKPMEDALVTEKGIDLEKALGGTAPVTGMFFTALKIEQEQTVAVHTPTGGLLFINGQEIKEDQLYKMPKGIHGMLVIVSADTPRGFAAPTVSLATDRKDVSAAVARDQARLAMEKAIWDATGADMAKWDFINVGYWKNYRHYRWGIGDGGFQAETGVYAHIASWYPMQYAAAYRTVFGRDASPYDDVNVLLVRRMMQMVLYPAGKPGVQKLNSVESLNPELISTTFPIVPEKYKPAMLWTWNNLAGVTDEKSTGNIIQGNPLEMAYAFTRYPLDMKPVHPKEVMPLHWEARTFGFHVARNSWEGTDEFVGQAFLKASLVGGWNHPNAGTFRLYGLGKPWNTGSTERVGFRLHEPVVQLPEDEISEGAYGKLAHHETSKDGSLNMTIDLGDVYAKKGARLMDNNLLRLVDEPEQGDVDGLRAIAFDYSGKSGAPCLLVLIDKIDGGKRREWLWPVPFQGGPKDKPVVKGNQKFEVKTAENTFTIDYGDANLKATFVAPAGAAPQFVTEDISVGKIGDSHRSFVGKLSRVKAVAPAGHFFVVATVQKGAAPKVEAAGEGLGATVKVGGQTVRFDGRKIILGN